MKKVIKEKVESQRLILTFKLKHYFKSHLFGLSGLLHLITKLGLLMVVYIASMLLIINLFITPNHIFYTILKILIISTLFSKFNNYQDGDYKLRTEYNLHDLIIYLTGIIVCITIGLETFNMILLLTILLLVGRFLSILIDKSSKLYARDIVMFIPYLYFIYLSIINFNILSAVLLILVLLSILNLINKLLLLYRKKIFTNEYKDQFEFNIVDIYDDKFSYENSNVFCYEPNQSGKLICLYFKDILTAYNRDITYLSLEPDNNKTMVLVPIEYFKSKKSIFLMITGKDFALQVEIVGGLYSDNPYIEKFVVSNFSKIKENQELNDKEIKDFFSWLQKTEKKINKKSLYRNMQEFEVYFLRAINDYNILESNIELAKEEMSIVMGDKGKSVSVYASLAKNRKTTTIFSLYNSRNIVFDLHKSLYKINIELRISVIIGILISLISISSLFSVISYYTNKQSFMSYLDKVDMFNIEAYKSFLVTAILITLIFICIIYQYLRNKKYKSNDYASSLLMIKEIDSHLIKHDKYIVLEDLELVDVKEPVYQFLNLIKSHSVCSNRYIVVGNDEVKITNFGKIIKIENNFSVIHHSKMLKELKIITEDIEDFIKIEST